MWCYRFTLLITILLPCHRGLTYVMLPIHLTNRHTITMSQRSELYGGTSEAIAGDINCSSGSISFSIYISHSLSHTHSISALCFPVSLSFATEIIAQTNPLTEHLAVKETITRVSQRHKYYIYIYT